MSQAEDEASLVEGSEKRLREGAVWVVMAGVHDVPHISDEDVAIAKTGWAEHEWEARTKGIPILGSGSVYQFPESQFTVAPFEIPPEWPRVYGLDPGWRCTAAVFLALDPKERIYYIARVYKERKKVAAVHAGNIMSMLTEGWPMGVCDPSASSHNAGDGQQLLVQYRGLGLNLWRASNTVDAGILKCQNLLYQNRFKVFSTCVDFFREYRKYRRDLNGKIVKKDDHLMDAWRYVVMSGIHLLESLPKKRTGDFSREQYRKSLGEKMKRGNWMV